MSAEKYCPVYERLRKSFNLKLKNCVRADNCSKIRRDCVVIKDVRTEELASKYESPEDLAQDAALRKLEQATNPPQV